MGVTIAGTGTGGTADCNDLIGSSGTNIDAAASVWGAGGADTIRFGTAAEANVPGVVAALYSAISTPLANTLNGLYRGSCRLNVPAE